MATFKQQFTLEQRKAESERIRNKYADRIPVICEKADRSDVPDIDKKKVGRALANCLSQEPQTVLTMRVRAEQFLVPHDLTVGQFMFVIRKRIKVPAEKGIFLFVQGTHPANGMLMSTLYEEYKDEDGFLYMTYSGETTFG